VVANPRRGPAGGRDQRKCRLWLSRRRPAYAGARLPAGRGAGRGDRGTGRLPGFGRRFIDVDPDDLRADALYQIGALDAFARAAGSRVAYVKPHGALYNAVVHHERQASAVVASVTAYDGELDLLGLPGSRLLSLGAAAGLRTIGEGFVDRGYTPDGRLVPRGEPGALVDAAAIPERAVRMARERVVRAVDGRDVHVPVESLCVHGDSPGAVAAGGWQLIGRTDETLWNEDWDPPALLSPGMRVRLVDQGC